MASYLTVAGGRRLRLSPVFRSLFAFIFLFPARGLFAAGRVYGRRGVAILVFVAAGGCPSGGDGLAVGKVRGVRLFLDEVVAQHLHGGGKRQG